MSPAQREALLKAAAADGPVKLPAVPARILHKRYGYVEPVAGSWQITAAGRAILDGEDDVRTHDEQTRAIGYENREWGERVAAWLTAHRRLDWAKGWSTTYERYAAHVAGCDVLGIVPVPNRRYGRWDDAICRLIEAEARSAAAILKDYDEAEKEATERDVGLTTHWTTDAKAPRAKAVAAEESERGGITSLSTYRARRPDRPGAA